jgi:hypothetical protein
MHYPSVYTLYKGYHMAQTIKLKRSAVAGRIPNVSDLELGEIAINTYDGKMYIKKSVDGEESISEIGKDNGLGAVFTSYTFTATANQTVFTGNDNYGSALDIVDEFSNVFMNGVLLDPEIDFTVSSDGLTLTLTEPAEADDILQINSFDKAIFNGTLNVDALALAGMTGEMVWNSDEETIDVPLNDDVTLQLGQEFVFRGKATEAISNGDVVMFAGAQGGHLLIAKADMSAAGFAPEHVIGMATQDFSKNDFGFVTELGKVRGLDTSGYSEGAILYLHPTTAGALTTTKPAPPSHAIQMCAVVRSHGTQGTLLVRPTHMVDTDEVAEGSSNLYFTVARAVAAIKADSDWNASDWDTAFGWGDHSAEGYLTSVAFDDLTTTPTTIAGYGITDAFDGAYSSLTDKPTLFSGSYTDLTDKPTIPTVPTTVSSFTNDSGYITDYSVTQGDVTAHQAALSITESQISDLDNYLTSETNTTLQIVGNTLRYTDETGTNTDIDLSLYLDDTNLSRLTSGSLDANGTATFTRDDDSTFTIDFSQFFDDTNLARITSAAFDTDNGVLTLTRDDATTITTDLDGRYLTSHQDISGKADLSGDTFTGRVYVDSSTNDKFILRGSNSPSVEFQNDADAFRGRIGVSELHKEIRLVGQDPDDVQGIHTLGLGQNGLRYSPNNGLTQYNVWHSGDFSSTKISNWNTAYGWGNHASAGYLTSHQDISGKADLSGDTFTGNLTVNGGYLEAHGFFYLRDDLNFLNSAGNGWHTIIEKNGGNPYFNAIDSYRINGQTVIDASRVGKLSKLEVQAGASGNNQVLKLTGNTSTSGEYTSILLHSNNPSGEWYGSEIRNINEGSSPGYLQPRLSFFTQNTDTYLPSGRTEKLSIDGGGNVRIHSGGLEVGSTTVIDSSRNLKSIKDIHQTEVHRPDVSYSVSGNTTGRIKIALPDTSSTYDMMTIELTVYEYNSKAGSKIYISGHNWTSGWYNTSVHVLGDYSDPIYLARSTTDGKNYIILGDVGTSWNYVTVHVDKVTTAGFYSAQDWTLGWSISKVTTDSTTYSQMSADQNQIGSVTNRTRGVYKSGGGYAIGSNTVIDSSRNATFASTTTGLIEMNQTSTSGYFGSASFSWAGNSSYPTLYGESADRWVMICFPHIPYMQNGQRGFTGTTRGAVSRYEGDIAGTTYWDAGVKSNIGANSYSITVNNTDWVLNVNNSDKQINAKYGYKVNNTTVIDSSRNLTNIASITTSGNLDINTSTQNAIEIFESSGSTGFNYMRFLNTTGSTQYGSIYRSYSSMIYGTSSDYRLKENVVDLTNAADRINAIPVRRFNFIEHPDRTVDGFIAHEVQAVVPEAVIGEKDEVDENGNPVYQGIDQSKLVPLLTAALQEALTEIKNLKARVSALEN